MDKHMQQKLMKIMDSNDLDQLDEFVNKHGVNYEINGTSLLFSAVYANKIVIVNRLLEIGADPNFKNQIGTSCLSLASYFGFVEISKTLIKYGAKITDFDCIERAYHGWDGHVQVEIINVFQEHGWINLYLDDLRDIPDGFVGARTVEEAND